ncbi:MAG TPA: divalent metal cation transporter [Casimicrobiaceae bacterium]|jgi:NRAMP (natural resistance-associated macrophage protein)-like metal ion transporter|nr:divalent metal cation transporter [Casimicrobiaceae bacterium]
MHPAVESLERTSHGIAPKRSDSFLAKLGPGLITGAADDDPSGIAAYSQSGAQFGYSLLWTLCFTYPLMVGIQVVSARIGRVSGYGLAGNIRRHYSPALLYAVVGLLLLANTINIGADIGAMADAMALLVGGPRHVYIVAIGAACIVLQVFISYHRYVRVLKWLTLSLFSYVAVAFAIDVPWADVLHGALLPSLTLDPDYVTTVVAILGTTISPYLFFWQASQECEDLHAVKTDKPLRDHPEQAVYQLRRIKIDTFLGMGFSNLIAFFIMLTTAATLHAHGIDDVGSSAQAAEALRPVAGKFAFLLFGMGIIGTGLLAVPVLAGSSAFALAESFRWRRGLDLSPLRGARFYSVIAISTLIGVGLGFTHIDPIKALYWAAVINGVISVPIMVTMMRMVGNPEVMGEFVATKRLAVLGWLATAVMAAAVMTMFLRMLH